MLRDTNALHSPSQNTYNKTQGKKKADLLDDIGAELLNRQSTDIPCELADNGVAEPVVVEIEDVLNDLAQTKGSDHVREERTETTHVVAVRVLNEGQSIVSDLVDELDALMVRGVVDATLEDATSVTVSRNFDAVSGNRIVDELNPRVSEPVQACTRDDETVPGYPPARACSNTFE